MAALSFHRQAKNVVLADAAHFIALALRTVAPTAFVPGMLGRGKEAHAKRIAAEEAAAAKRAPEEEEQAKDEGLDAVTVALDRIGQSLKIINDMTEDWGKTGLVRQQVKRAAELRSNLVKAAKEMRASPRAGARATPSRRTWRWSTWTT